MIRKKQDDNFTIKRKRKIIHISPGDETFLHGEPNGCIQNLCIQYE